MRLIAINSSNNDEVYYVTKNGETAIEQWNGSSTAITLKSGDSVTIYGLSANDSYTITEVEANANGYTTSIANAGSSKDGTAEKLRQIRMSAIQIQKMQHLRWVL